MKNNYLSFHTSIVIILPIVSKYFTWREKVGGVVFCNLFPIPQAVACEWAALQQHLLRITEERIHVNARRQLWCFEQHNRPSIDINWRGEKKQGRSRNSELTEASEKQRAGPHETGRLKDLSTSKTTFIFYVY